MAIYRWRVHSEKDEQFRDSWHRLTQAIRTVRGSLGSRLTRDAFGIYVAIALWPSREAWAAQLPALPNEAELLASLRDSVAESYATQLLDVVDNLW